MPIRILKSLARFVVLIIAIISTIWVYRAYSARSLPDLSIWHTYAMKNEYHAEDFPNGITFSEYRALEDRLFAELDEVIYSSPAATGRFNRYNKQSLSYAGEVDQQWNRSFELNTAAPRGGILMLHGASDSPNSTRALAKVFNDAGLYVLSLRIPGNGTIPSGLRDARIDDWLEIARMGVRHVRERIGRDLPLYMSGYSVGGALTINYAIESLHDTALETPDRLFLYTPALGVSKAARFSSWDVALSRFPGFEKFNWISVDPEFDPFKYNSFAKPAGHITFLLTESVRVGMKKLDDPAAMPPMIAFQSLADSTVRVQVLVDEFYTHLTNQHSELVLFDVNRAHDIEHFIADTTTGLIDTLALRNDLPFDYTLVTNTSADSEAIAERTKLSGSGVFETRDLGLAWPSSVYSLSHVALPFRPDDRYYGDVQTDDLQLGTLAPRGESDILITPIGKFMRLRHNPFFDYLAERTLAFCPACLRPETIEDSTP